MEGSSGKPGGFVRNERGVSRGGGRGGSSSTGRGGARPERSSRGRGGGREGRTAPAQDEEATKTPRRTRVSEAIDTSDGRFLKVGAESEAKKVAGKIAQVVREQGTPPTLLAAGANAINQAVKAIAIAKQYLAEEESGPIDLIAQPQFDGPSPRLSLHLKAVPQLVPNEAAEVLTVKRESDPYKVAGAIAGRIRDQKAVALVSVGPDSVFHSVESVAVTRRYLAEEQYDIKFSPIFQQMDWEGKDSSGLRFDIICRKLNA